jgi:hypothetical protein
MSSEDRLENRSVLRFWRSTKPKKNGMSSKKSTRPILVIRTAIFPTECKSPTKTEDPVTT